MGIIKRIKRWLRDPRRSPVRKPINQRSPVPALNTHTVTHHTPVHAGNASKEREDISRRMKEMVDHSTELRNAKNARIARAPRVYTKRGL